jgi:hypothetical protein
VINKACRYNKPKEIKLQSSPLFAGSIPINAWYNGPSCSEKVIFFGNKNSGSFNNRPKISRTTTLPGDFCLNSPIT